MKLPFKREVILNATISYSGSKQNLDTPLGVGRQVGQCSFDKFESDVRHLIETQLPEDISSIYGIQIKTRIIRFQSGSIEILFGIVLSAFEVISRYSSFYDSIHLIREHAQSLLSRLLCDDYHGSFSVGVQVNFPRLRDPYDYRYLRKHFDPLESDLLPFLAESPRSGSRDGFFWFLLVANILLTTVVGLLVWAAVSKVYFP